MSFFQYSTLSGVRVIEGGRARGLSPEHWAEQASARAEVFENAFRDVDEVALIGRTSLDLLLAWTGLILAGKTPCLLQYPTRKLERGYWQNSVLSSMRSCGLRACIVDGSVDNPHSLGVDPIIPLPIGCLPRPAAIRPITRKGSIIQLSSGTTGVRKGIRFELSTFALHVKAYAQFLGYGPDEVMASWLPLYHDMGFVTAWMLPIMTGARAILLDPMDWVSSPGRFFEIVQEHRATRCYQPNFALEVLARHYSGQNLSSLREVTSCSEPTRAATLAKFSRVTGLPWQILSNCYAMAENIFAVSHARSPDVMAIDGREYVSCGQLVTGVEAKLADGQIWVKSPFSLTGYVGGPEIADKDGFYPTGDTGRMINGELVVQGRIRDVIISGGEKFLLSDVDHAVALEAPWSRGRACALSGENDSLGTGEALVLIEHELFWDKSRQAAPLAAAVSARSGLSLASVSFVPPGFITKTSSGKVNRGLTARNFALARQSMPSVERPGLEASTLLAQFPSLSLGGPVGTLVDSLGFLNLNLMLADHGLACGPDETAESLLARLDSRDADGEVLLVVSLACAVEDAFFTPEYVDELAKAVGVPVHFERMVVPRADILLSDLIFHDWFMPRKRDHAYDAFASAASRIRQASILILGDTPELRHPLFNAYPRLAHDFRRDAGADRLAMRWAGYFAGHHRLPVRVESSHGFDPAFVNSHLEQLGSYLGTPLYRMAFDATHAGVTGEWEYVDHREPLDYRAFYKNPWPSHPRMQEAFTSFVRSLPQLRLTHGPARNRRLMVGTSHYCGWLVEEELIDRAVAFCGPYGKVGLAGPECSVPAVARRLRENGKDVVQLQGEDGQCFDVFLQTGYDEAPYVGRPGMLLMDHPLSRLSRYARSPVPLPRDQFTEFLDASRQHCDAREARRLLAMHARCARTDTRQSLAAARDIPAGHLLVPGDIMAVDGAEGIPAWLAPCLAGRQLTIFLEKGSLFPVDGLA